MKDISEKRLSDYMAEQIADEILSGRIPGGSQLKQEELEEAFEASRIQIREAFQIQSLIHICPSGPNRRSISRWSP